LCDGSPAVLVGRGNSAGQAAVFLADSGGPVSVVSIRGPIRARHVTPLVDRIETHPRIDVYTNSQVTLPIADKTLNAVRT